MATVESRIVSVLKILKQARLNTLNGGVFIFVTELVSTIRKRVSSFYGLGEINSNRTKRLYEDS